MGILKIDDDHDLNYQIMRGKMKYLKIEDLKPFYTYRIQARNGRVGIWHPDEGEFKLARTKGYDTFVFGEIHYDLSDQFGTAKPLEELEKSPFKAKDFDYKIDGPYLLLPKEEAILDYLQQWEDKITDPHPMETL